MTSGYHREVPPLKIHPKVFTTISRIPQIWCPTSPTFSRGAASPPPSGPGPRLWSLLSPLSISCSSVWGHSNPARASAFHSSLQAMAWDRESTNVVPWCAALYSHIWNIKFPYCTATLGILSPYYCCISSYTLFLTLIGLSVLVCDLTVFLTNITYFQDYSFIL